MTRITLFILLFFGSLTCLSQNKNALSDVYLLHLANGDTVNGVIENPDGAIIVVSFSIFCGPCREELKGLSEIYNEWKKIYHVKIIAVSNDFPEKYRDQVYRFAKSHNYNFELYLDFSQNMANFFYSMENTNKDCFNFDNGKPGILNPQTLIVDKNGTLIKQIRGYLPDNDAKIEEILDELKNQ
jgi:peroxiredoxin